MQNLSLNSRKKLIEEMTSTTFDLIVVGGGITGAGILLDAQSRGINTLLFEMQDFAAGTSSRSTKLIHGGLRYLKQFEFKLVAEVGQERSIVYNNGMHTTRPETMLLPIVKNGSINKLGAWFGLWFYDKLAGVKTHEKRIMLSKEQTLKLEPLLDEETVLGGAQYYEYRTDDARLTIELIKAATALGASALNYFKVTGFRYSEQGKINGVHVEDLLTHLTFEIQSKCVVNAAGPWVDDIDGIDSRKNSKKMVLTKGVHIVVDASSFPVKNAMYFDAMDGRMVFAIPRDGKVYIGTTDTEYHGNIEHPLITSEDRRYLLDVVNKIFRNQHLTDADIESGWAGLRPLVKQKNNDNPTAISRKDELFEFASGLITIAGGKLTGYRKMAERTVDLVSKRLKNSGQNIKECNTKYLKISGGDFESEAQFYEFVKIKTSVGIELGLSQKDASALVYRYGTNINQVYSIMHRNSAEELAQCGLPTLVLAELKYCIAHEAVLTPSDFFIRRTSALYFNIEWVRAWKTAVSNYMAQYFGWSEPGTNKHLQELELYITEASTGV